MSLRDPRMSKAVQVAFVAISALWLVNFSTQETRSTLQLGIATSEYRSPRWIFIFAVARHLEAHRVEARRAHQHSGQSEALSSAAKRERYRFSPENASSTFVAPGTRPYMARTICLDCQRCSVELTQRLAESRPSKSAATLVDKRPRWLRRLVCAGPCPAALVLGDRSLVATPYLQVDVPNHYPVAFRI
jgi:hypothetical protein